MVKAILFDLDDTLIDWGHFFENWESIEDNHLPGVFEYLCTLGTPRGDVVTFKRGYLERTRQAWMSARTTLIAPNLGRILVETAMGMGIPRDKIDLRTCLEAYKWRAIPGTFPFPDVIEGLGRLRSSGLKMGIITNAYQPMWLRDIEMEEHGLLEFFPDCRFSAADLGRLKPHPEVFAKALACLGTTAEETIFIGDNPTADIAGAQAAGMRAVIRVNQKSRPILSGLIVPDGAINSLIDLFPILDEWSPGWEENTR